MLKGSIGFYINPSKPDSYVNISAILGAIITFLITALVVYFVFVAPMKKVLDIAARGTRRSPTEVEPARPSVLLEQRASVLDRGAGRQTDPPSTRRCAVVRGHRPSARRSWPVASSAAASAARGHFHPGLRVSLEPANQVPTRRVSGHANRCARDLESGTQ